MAERKLGLGFIGLGQAANLVLRDRCELASLPYRIAAAAEVRPQALEVFRNEFGGETYDSVEALCASPNVDVVYVATGPELHREHVITALEHNKHVIVEKPMALTVADCKAMIEAADRTGMHMLAGHTHSFDAPIRKMREIVDSGSLGRVVHVESWNCNEFNRRPWPTAELRSTYGPLLNQGPHHVDIMRQLIGEPVRGVRGSVFWDPVRNCEGGYSCFLDFESGISAQLTYDGRGFFDTAELFEWTGEGGQNRDPASNVQMQRRFAELQLLGAEPMEAELERRKELGRYGAPAGADSWANWGYSATIDFPNQPFFGLTLVNCERGAMRQSPHGLLVYDEQGRREVPLDKEVRGRAAELMELYNTVVHGKPAFHDGRWGMATLEICLAMLASSRERKEILLT